MAPRSKLGLIAATALAALVFVAGHETIPHEGLHQAHAEPAAQSDTWAFQETFDGTPSSPSRDLLPRRFDYEWTQRQHLFHVDGYPDTASSGGFYGTYPASHSDHCDPPPTTHTANNMHRTNGGNPDQAFYICNNHIMSAVANIGSKYYSIASFWPRQEFDFSGGGVLEFDTDLADSRDGGSWWEVALMPRQEFVASPAIWWRPWDGDRYPKDRIVLAVRPGGSGQGWARLMTVGKGAIEPSGVTAEAGDWTTWNNLHPGDPALTDPRIRRKHRIEISNSQILWKTQTADGGWDTLTMPLPSGLPMTRALVNFKTHTLGGGNPDGNPNWTPDNANHTVHWDTIRFTGPVLAPYVAYEASPPVLDLEATRNPTSYIPISQGTTDTQTVTLPAIGANPILAGQTHAGAPGHILLSVNGGPKRTVLPMMYPAQSDEAYGGNQSDPSYCFFNGWRQFRIPLNASELRTGDNTLTWEVGPPTTCTNQQWWPNGFGVKATEIQFDGTGTPPPPPTTVLSPTPTLTPVLTPTSTAVAATETPTSTATVLPTSTAVPPTATVTPVSTVTRTPTAVVTVTPTPACTPIPVGNSNNTRCKRG